MLVARVFSCFMYTSEAIIPRIMAAPVESNEDYGTKCTSCMAGAEGNVDVIMSNTFRKSHR